MNSTNGGWCKTVLSDDGTASAGTKPWQRQIRPGSPRREFSERPRAAADCGFSWTKDFTDTGTAWNPTGSSWERWPAEFGVCLRTAEPMFGFALSIEACT